MPQSISFSLSVNRASAAMPSHAARSRIPVHVNVPVNINVPVNVNIPVHVNVPVNINVPVNVNIPVHVNDSVVPAAASHSPVKTADDIATLFSTMSISKPTTVKATSASPSTSHASKSKLPLTATDRATKDCPPLRQHRQRSLPTAAPSVNSASVSDRIAERRQRVIANLAAGSKRPTPPVKVTPTSTFKSSSTSSRVPSFTAAPVATSQPSSTPPAAVVPVADPVATDPVAVPVPALPAAVPAPRRYGWLTVQMPENYRQGTEGKIGHIVHIVEISDRLWDAESLIPSASTGRKPRPRLPGRFKPATIPLTRTHIPHQLSPVFLPHTVSHLPEHFSPVYLPRHLKPDKIRGTSDYCAAVPHDLKPRGNYGYGVLYKGRACNCAVHDGDIPSYDYLIPPKEWATTPAETGVDPHPPRKVRTKPPKKVRFAEDLIETFAGLRDPAASFRYQGTSKDKTTRAEDFPEGFPLYEDDYRRPRLLRR